MRKCSSKKKSYLALKHRKIIAKQTRNAHRHKHETRRFKLLEKASRKANPDFYETRDLRKKMIKITYKKKSYDSPIVKIDIEKDLGIENPDDIDYFLDKASTFIDFNSKHLYLDFSKCNRVWPSGITLLCSLKQWAELTSQAKRKPIIMSSSSNNVRVNSYLGHCGFYDYVGRKKDTDENYYSNKEVVKIQREKRRSNGEERENEITDLLRQYSVLTENEIMMFDSIILTEVFSNVTEHGISKVDAGWWILAQYHQTHKFISISIADNGIGIRNSLMTGPQRNEIKRRLNNDPKNDGQFICHALTENVSGALAASQKKGLLVRRYESGSRRGHGLKRISSCCSKLKIPFAIISHYGYTFLDADGQIVTTGAKLSKVFAGTMYHFSIKTK